MGPIGVRLMCPHETTELRADVLDDGLLHRLEGALDGARRVNHHPASPSGHATHLGDSRSPIVHEHEAHLAEYHVVGFVGELERGGVADAPVDGRARVRDGLGDLDHIRGEVNAGNRPVGTDLTQGLTCLSSYLRSA